MNKEKILDCSMVIADTANVTTLCGMLLTGIGAFCYNRKLVKIGVYLAFSSVLTEKAATIVCNKSARDIENDVDEEANK